MGEYEDCLKDGKDAAVCLKESLLRNGKPTMKKYDEYAKSEGGRSKRRRKSRRQNKSKRARKTKRRRY